MITSRSRLVLAGLLGLFALAGCNASHDSSGTVTRTSGDWTADSHSEPAIRGGVISRENDDQITTGADLTTEQPASEDPVGVEDHDAQVGEEADRTGANPLRLKGIEIKNLSRDGHVWVGGEPTLKGYHQVHELGVTAIVDLRNPTPDQQKSAAEARRLGLDYVNLPIDPKNMDDEKADAFLRFMREHEGDEVLIHCGSANRASAMYAVYLGALKGLSTDEAIARAKRTGLREEELERDVRDYLGKREKSER